MMANMIWTLYFFIAVYPVQIFGTQSFCMAKSVSAGETATISCFFTKDLSKPPEKDVNVYLYKVSENTTDPVIILFYNWFNGIPRIQLKTGYALQGNLTDHLLVVIHNVTKEHAGDYKCIAVGYPGKLCTLHVKQDFEMPNTTNPMSDIGYTDADDISTAESGISNDTVIIVCSCIAVILAVSLTVFVAIKKRWICKPDGNNNNETNGQSVTFINQNSSSGNPQLRSAEQENGTAQSSEISSLIPSEQQIQSTQDHTKTSTDVLSCCE